MTIVIRNKPGTEGSFECFKPLRGEPSPLIIEKYTKLFDLKLHILGG